MLYQSDKRQIKPNWSPGGFAACRLYFCYCLYLSVQRVKCFFFLLSSILWRRRHMFNLNKHCLQRKRAKRQGKQKWIEAQKGKFKEEKNETEEFNWNWNPFQGFAHRNDCSIWFNYYLDFLSIGFCHCWHVSIEYKTTTDERKKIARQRLNLIVSTYVCLMFISEKRWQVLAVFHSNWFFFSSPFFHAICVTQSNYYVWTINMEHVIYFGCFDGKVCQVFENKE